MYNGIIFHEMQQKAFLSIAAEEQLICEKGITDGIYDKWTKYLPSYEFGKQILEQFCIAGTVYVDPHLYKCLDGELIDQGIIQPYRMDKKIRLGKFVYDVDMIQIMLAEKGYYYSVQKITEIFKELQDQSRELFSIIEKNPGIEHKYFTSPVSLQLGLLNNKEIDIINRYGDLIHQLDTNPISQICQEYERIVSVAYQNDLLSTVSTGQGTLCECNFCRDGQYIQESDNAIMVSRYTSERLGRIYTASSLKDCIELTQTDEAKAYREKIDEFINSLAENNFTSMEKVDKEIEKVLAAIRTSNSLATWGRIVTVASIATVIATPFIIDPNMAEFLRNMGIIITFASFPSSFCAPSKKYLWASYGIINN